MAWPMENRFPKLPGPGWLIIDDELVPATDENASRMAHSVMALAAPRPQGTKRRTGSSAPQMPAERAAPSCSQRS